MPINLYREIVKNLYLEAGNMSICPALRQLWSERQFACSEDLPLKLDRLTDFTVNQQRANDALELKKAKTVLNLEQAVNDSVVVDE